MQEKARINTYCTVYQYSIKEIWIFPIVFMATLISILPYKCLIQCFSSIQLSGNVGAVTSAAAGTTAGAALGAAPGPPFSATTQTPTGAASEAVTNGALDNAACY